MDDLEADKYLCENYWGLTWEEDLNGSGEAGCNYRSCLMTMQKKTHPHFALMSVEVDLNLADIMDATSEAQAG